MSGLEKIHVREADLPITADFAFLGEENSLERARIDYLNSTTQLRKKIVKPLAWVLGAWSVFVAIVVAFCGFGWFGFALESAPFTTLIGTVGAGMTLFGFVVRGLFHSVENTQK